MLSKTLLVQFKLPEDTVLPAEVRVKEPETADERVARVAKTGREVAFTKHGGTLAGLPTILQNGGYQLVDAFAQKRENDDGKPHMLLTYVFSTTPRERKGAPLGFHCLPMTLFIDSRWSTIFGYNNPGEKEVSAIVVHGETPFPLRVVAVDDSEAAACGIMITKAGLSPTEQAKRDAFLAKKNATA